MTVEDTRPAWVRELLEELERGPTPEQLRKRREAFEAIKKMRLSIGSDSVVDYIRELRGPVSPEDECEETSGD